MANHPPRTRTVTRLSLTLERIEETFPSSPFAAARKTIVVEGETLSDSELPSRPGVVRGAPVVHIAARRVAGAR